MIETGELALRLALAVTVLGLVFGAAGLVTRRAPWLEAAVRCLHVNFLCASLATLSLVAAFLEPAGVPMTLQYVAANSSRDMPAFYKVAALWGGMAGSLLFWVFLLTLFSVLALLSPEARRRTGSAAGTATTLLLVQLFFFVLLVFVQGSQPFARLDAPQADGRGLNPLLQHPGMAIHPPVLYLGFVSMAVPFAFGMGALFSGDLGTQWIRVCRRWTIMGWSFLSCGIALGGLWAYLELGWGGYWAWDPVENASFMPWLVATAFLHSVMIQEHRGMLKVWNLLLILLTFLMTLFGTFLTRSGLLASVHTFAQNKELAWTFLTFMGLVLCGGIGLILWRRPRLASENRMESFLSREFAFLANNVVLLALMVTILIGTVLPLVSEQLFGRKISVGPPWFNLYTIPQFLLLLLLTGWGPLVAWRKASPANLRRNFTWPVAAGLGGGLGMLVFLLASEGRAALWPLRLAPWAAAAGSAVAAFVLATLVLEFARGTWSRRERLGEGRLVAFVRLVLSNRRRYGGYVVHAAVIAVFMGIVCSSAFQTEVERTLKPGESIQVGRYRLVYRETVQVRRPEYQGQQDRVDAYLGQRRLATLRPENRHYFASQQSTSEVALRTTLGGDLYLVTVGRTDDGRVTFLAFNNPLVGLIWGGVLLLLAGGLLAAWPGGGTRAPQAGSRAARQPALEEIALGA